VEGEIRRVPSRKRIWGKRQVVRGGGEGGGGGKEKTGEEREEKVFQPGELGEGEV